VGEQEAAHRQNSVLGAGTQPQQGAALGGKCSACQGMAAGVFQIL